MDYLESDCGIDNCFHSSAKGCKILIRDDGTRIHRFNLTNVTLATDGGAMVNKLELFTNKYQILFPLGDCRGRVGKIISNNYNSIDKYITSGMDVVNVVMLIIEFIDDIVNYTKKNGPSILYPTAKSMFDCYMDETGASPKLGFFRPILFTNSYQCFLEGFQSGIIELFRMAGDKMPTQKKLYKSTGQNQKICVLNYLIKHSTKLLECNDKSRECFHEIDLGVSARNDENRDDKKKIMEHENEFDELNDYMDGKQYRHPPLKDCFDLKQDTDNYEKTKSKTKKQSKSLCKIPVVSSLSKLPYCKKVWLKMNCDNGLSNLLKFKCQHSDTDSAYAQMLQETFKRTVKIHTILCFPHQLLNKIWYDELLLFFRQTTESQSFMQAVDNKSDFRTDYQNEDVSDDDDPSCYSSKSLKRIKMF